MESFGEDTLAAIVDGDIFCGQPEVIKNSLKNEKSGFCKLATNFRMSQEKCVNTKYGKPNITSQGINLGEYFEDSLELLSITSTNNMIENFSNHNTNLHKDGMRKQSTANHLSLCLNNSTESVLISDSPNSSLDKTNEFDQCINLEDLHLSNASHCSTSEDVKTNENPSNTEMKEKMLCDSTYKSNRPMLCDSTFNNELKNDEDMYLEGLDEIEWNTENISFSQTSLEKAEKSDDNPILQKDVSHINNIIGNHNESEETSKNFRCATYNAEYVTSNDHGASITELKLFTSITEKKAGNEHSFSTSKDSERTIISHTSEANKSRAQTISCSMKSTSFVTVVPQNCSISTNGKVLDNEDKLLLRNWGLPPTILREYANRGITQLFPWQVECLEHQGILDKGENLVYSAPTSAGKTLVAEILMIKTVLERHKKVLVILPFVSVVREKMFYFQDILGSSGVRVSGFMGSHSPPGGFQATHVAVCTIEKANSLINRVLMENTLDEIGAIVLDELHLIGDSGRGYILELLLTKVRYMLSKDKKINIQLIGMSATLPNLPLLATWLNARLYKTFFRPIPLEEQCKIDTVIYNNENSVVRHFIPYKDFPRDPDNIIQLCTETISQSCSVLIFCPTKNWCENLSQQISNAFMQLMRKENHPIGVILREQLNMKSIEELREQLKNCPVGLDSVLKNVINYSCAFHHAGLTMDERDIIEGGFRNNTLRVLIATSTLSSGVNLPARRVIIRSPIFHGKPLNSLTYKQMIGRAGRMGRDTKGESLLVCTKKDENVARKLISANLQPVYSCLEGEGKLKRAILEIIASGMASSPEDIELFTKSTLLSVSKVEGESQIDSPIKNTVKFLMEFELMRLQNTDEGPKYLATPLGKACLSSSLPPEDGLMLFTELQRARQCLVLETELHLVYLVTPYSVSSQLGNIDWMLVLELWEQLTPAMKKVGDLVGVQESFLVRAVRGTLNLNTSKMMHKLQIHRRFYTALALQELVNEVPLTTVAEKYKCSRGVLQSLQQSAATFAGMVTSFSHQLGWDSIEILISQFQHRLQFGVQRDLIDLMRLPLLNGNRARAIFKSGIETLLQLATADVCILENALHSSIPFQSEQKREDDCEYDVEERNKLKSIWVTGKAGLTPREAANMLILDARRYLEIEMGLSDVNWNNKKTEDVESWNSSETCSMKEELEDSRETCVKLVGQEVEIQRVDTCTDRNNENSRNNKKNEDLGSWNSSETCSVYVAKEENENSRETCVRLIKQDIPEVEIQRHNISTERNNVNFDSNKNVDLVQHNTSDSSNNSLISSLDLSDKSMKDNFVRNSNKNITVVSNVDIIQNNSGKEYDFRNNQESDIINMKENIDVINISGTNSSAFQDSLSLNSRLVQDLDIIDDFNSKLKTNDKIKTPPKTELEQTSTIINLETPMRITRNMKRKSESPPEHDTKRISTADEVITCSQDEETNTPKSLRELSRTQKNSKRLKRKDKTSCEKNVTESIVNPIENSTNNIGNVTNDIYKIELVNVTANLNEFLRFNEFIKTISDMSVSVECGKLNESKSVIGKRIIAPDLMDSTEAKYNCVMKDIYIKGIHFYTGDNKLYFVSLQSDSPSITLKQRIDLLNIIFRSKSKFIRVYDCKKTYKLLYKGCQIETQAKLCDPKIADWLLNSKEATYTIMQMIQLHLPNLMQKIESLEITLETSVESISTWLLLEVLNKRLKENAKLYKAFTDTEMPSVVCLAKMEINGICLKCRALQKLNCNIEEKMQCIQNEAYKIAGKQFNMSSSKEVAKVLGIFKGRRVSTSKQVLESINTPISNLIMLWRKLNNTLTKIIYPLLRNVTEYNRLHGYFIMQTLTGRITMSDPNIQNVPKDFSVDQDMPNLSCRSVFRARDGYCIVSADYCQLELRILSHLSKDPILCSILSTKKDVFKSIAALWNNLSEEEIDDTLRQRTKQIIYGMIYGMGTKALAHTLNVTELESASFLEAFNKAYPGLNRYTKSVIKECSKNGYVETINGRRRYLPNINQQNASIKGQAERQAVNTTVQGSAADISKMAMLRVEHTVNKKNPKCNQIYAAGSAVSESDAVYLILHMHDELIYEVKSTFAMEFAKILKESMENVIKLNVSLPVKVKMGDSWGTVTELHL